MKSKPSAADADMTKAGQALERAAARARQLAEQTGTPLYVFKDGRVVDLNRQSTGSYVLREALITKESPWQPRREALAQSEIPAQIRLRPKPRFGNKCDHGARP
jgi:hypothetical protein